MKRLKSISIIIPCYNEPPEVLYATIQQVEVTLEKSGVQYEVLVVDDGSKENYSLHSEFTRLLRHRTNRGYGAALKTGIKNAKYDWIGITDADGTYPNHLLGELIGKADSSDMVIGARKWAHIRGARKIPKIILTRFAAFLIGQKIPDLNSGMRIFRKDLAFQFWNLLPSGFSFTSTITIGALSNDYEVEFVEIDYFKRVGQSSIHPIKDTVRFFLLVTRLALYFNPKKVFIPFSFFMFLLATLRGTRDYLVEGSLGGVCLLLFFLGFQIFFFGLIAEIINKTRRYLVSNKNISH